jgi:mono/diheme cytochrome c family protein
MWQTNLKIIGIVLGTLGLYTLVASSIPQVASEVPEELTFTGEVSAEELVAAGEELYSGAGSCTTCHGTGTRAPNLLTDHNGEGTIGARCGDRVAGEACKAYLYQSLVEPAAHVVEGFPAMVFQARTFSDAQLWSMVAYLESQGGTVTVTGDDIDTSGDAGGSATGVTMTPGTGPGGAAGGTTDARQLLQDQLCLGCHAIDGAGPPLGPSFDGIGGRLNAQQIRTAILEPNAGASPGFEALMGVMPATYGQQLTAAQLEAIVTYLSSRN